MMSCRAERRLSTLRATSIPQLFKAGRAVYRCRDGGAGRFGDALAKAFNVRAERIMTTVNLDSLDLSALLCSRVCHDVISPVGAIVNGLEVLEDEDDASMRDFAIDLIRKSARQASARLQFARLAFGAAGSAGASIDLADAEKVSRGMFADEKTQLAWSAPQALYPKNKVKLLLNLVVIATSAIPRGGLIDVVVTGDGEAPSLVLKAKGSHARIPPHVESLIAGTPEGGTVDAHGILPYYAGLVARAAAMDVRFTIDGDEVTVRAEPVAAASPAAQAPSLEDSRPSDSEPPETALA